MKRPFSYLLVATLFLVSAEANAQQQWDNAQITTSPIAGNQYVVLGGTKNAGGLCGQKFCVQPHGINLNDFANENDVNARFAALSSQFNNEFLFQSHSFGKAFDLIAASAALKDAIPNPGDRFALRINAGGFNSHLAGGLSGSVNINDRVRMSVGYAYGGSEVLFSGGVNFSFH